MPTFGGWHNLGVGATEVSIACFARSVPNDLVQTNTHNLMNTRDALRVNDAVASRMILEEPGAERLQRHGDMLLQARERHPPLAGLLRECGGQRVGCTSKCVCPNLPLSSSLRPKLPHERGRPTLLSLVSKG